MCRVILTLSCLVFVCHGHQWHQSGLNPTRDEHQALASLLLAFKPEAAFNSVGAQLPVGIATHAGSRPMMSMSEQTGDQVGIGARLSKRMSSSNSRRQALTFAGLAGLANVLLPQTALAASSTAPVKDLKEQLLWIKRVQEATSQQSRLVKTGKYRDLQRLNIKRGVNMMLRNYQLQERFNTATGFMPSNYVPRALAFARTAVDDLQTVIDYFPEALSADSLTDKQKEFVLSALDGSAEAIDAFLAMMPVDLVKEVSAQIKEENKMNFEEYPKDMEMLNMPKDYNYEEKRAIKNLPTVENQRSTALDLPVTFQ